MMTLLFAGHIKPIGPMKTFPFTDIPGAFRYMRGGTHVGKIVITNGPAGQPKVKVCFEKRADIHTTWLPSSKQLSL